MANNEPYRSGPKPEQIKIIESNCSTLAEFEKMVDKWLAEKAETIVIVGRSHSITRSSKALYRSVAIWYRECD